MPFNKNPFSADRYTIEKDATSGRLKSIHVKTIDKFNEFAVNLGKSLGAIKKAFGQEGGQQAAGLCASTTSANVIVLATLDFDPAEDEQTQGDLAGVNEVIMRFARQKALQCGPLTKLVLRKRATTEELQADDACREYHRITTTYDTRNPPIRMRWLAPKTRRALKQDCSVGFRHRHTLPHTIQVAMAGGSVHSYTYQLPNASPIVAMDITRAITATKTTKVDFGDLGQITKIYVQKGNEDGSKGSEAEGLALLPFNIITAYFSGMSDTGKAIAGTFTPVSQSIQNNTALDNAETNATNRRNEQAEKLDAGEPPEDYAVVASNGLSTGTRRAAPPPARNQQSGTNTPSSTATEEAGPLGTGTPAQ